MVLKVKAPTSGYVHKRKRVGRVFFLSLSPPPISHWLVCRCGGELPGAPLGMAEHQVTENEDLIEREKTRDRELEEGRRERERKKILILF